VGSAVKTVIDWIVGGINEFIVEPVKAALANAINALIAKLPRLIFVLLAVPNTIRTIKGIPKAKSVKEAVFATFKIPLILIGSYIASAALSAVLGQFWGVTPAPITVPGLTLPSGPSVPLGPETIAQSDRLNISDVPSIVAEALPSVAQSDFFNISDAPYIVATEPGIVVVVDMFNMSDTPSVGAVAPASISQSDTLNVSDAATITSVEPGAVVVSDVLSISDELTIGTQGEVSISQSDTLNVSDELSISLPVAGALTEEETIYDFWFGPPTIEAVTVGEVSIFLSDRLNISDVPSVTT